LGWLKYKICDYIDDRMSLPSSQIHAAGVLRLLQPLNHNPDVLELQRLPVPVVGDHAPAHGDGIIDQHHGTAG